MRIPNKFAQLLALLDGPLDRTAAEIVYRHGALSVFEESAIGEAISKLDPRDEHFSEFTRLNEKIGQIPDEQPDALWSAVWIGVGDRQEVAYLLASRSDDTCRVAVRLRKAVDDDAPGPSSIGRSRHGLRASLVARRRSRLRRSHHRRRRRLAFDEIYDQAVERFDRESNPAAGRVHAIIERLLQRDKSLAQRLDSDYAEAMIRRGRNAYVLGVAVGQRLGFTPRGSRS